MNKLIFIILFFGINFNLFAQREEAYITRTTSTNSVFPRQFPEMTIRKMSDKEYYLYESLSTNTIFHRQFPTYIIRKENYGTQKYRYGVYRTLNTNTIFHAQFPDRYIGDLSSFGIKDDNYKQETTPLNKSRTYSPRYNTTENNQSHISGYSYSSSLRTDGKRAYSPESPE
jgi:hypothetical protein